MSAQQQADDQAAAVLLYSRYDDGHRLAFVRQFSTLLAGERATAGQLWFARRPVLFLMVEEAFVFYVIAAVFRAALGARTCGFLFRPGPALDRTDLRMRFKRKVLSLLRLLPGVTTLTIVPFSVEPRFSLLADGWIDDPQQWDLCDEDLEYAEANREVAGPLAFDIRSAASGRNVVGAIGRQDQDKGFDLLVSTYVGDPDLRAKWLFCVGGKVDSRCQTAAQSFVAVGGYLTDRRVTDQEILELYAASDFVWCCYSAGYDQSSGVMGRAAQLGVPAIVRHGSLLHRICETEDIAHVALRPGATPTLARGTADPARGRRMRDKMKTRSLQVIRNALFAPELVHAR